MQMNMVIKKGDLVNVSKQNKIAEVLSLADEGLVKVKYNNGKEAIYHRKDLLKVRKV